MYLACKLLLYVWFRIYQLQADIIKLLPLDSCKTHAKVDTIFHISHFDLLSLTLFGHLSSCLPLVEDGRIPYMSHLASGQTPN